MVRRCYAYAEFGEIRSGAPPCGPFGRASRGFPPSFALRCIPTPAPWTVQWHLKALKSARGLRRNRISPRSFPRDTCDNLRPNRPWRSPRVKNQAIELANSSHWRGRCSHVDSVEKSAYAKHLRTNKDPPLSRSDPHLCLKTLIFHRRIYRVSGRDFDAQTTLRTLKTLVGSWRSTQLPYPIIQL